MGSEPVAWRWYCRASEDFEYLDNERGDFDAYRAAHPQTTFRPLYDEATLSAQEEQIARLTNALEHCVTIVDHAVEHYKGCVSTKIKREITVHARRALEGSKRDG